MSHRKRWLGLALLIGSIPGWAQSSDEQSQDQKIQELQQKVDQLGQQIKATDNPAKAQRRCPPERADSPSSRLTATLCCASASICKSTIEPTTARGPRQTSTRSCSAAPGRRFTGPLISTSISSCGPISAWERRPSTTPISSSTI